VVVWLATELLVLGSNCSTVIGVSTYSYSVTGAFSNEEQRHKWWFNSLYMKIQSYFELAFRQLFSAPDYTGMLIEDE
jgi:hypothetical protein